MLPTHTFGQFLWLWGLLAFSCLLVLLKVPAPYGRFNKIGWGPQVSNRLAWICMEAVSPVLLLVTYLYFEQTRNKFALFFCALWVIHYLNRTIIFPLRTKTSGKTMPLIIAVFACIFNSINGFSNGYWFAQYSNFPADWAVDLRFWGGLIFFLAGFLINLHSDEILLNLRKPGEKSYKIPYGGFYTYVSSPNYLGEIIEWAGFALMTFSPAALVFLIWTISNLVPRAMANHSWYKKNFENYPSNRKALIPNLL